MEYDPLAPVPRYKQIAAILRGRIEGGELEADRPIPSEAQIQQESHAALDGYLPLCGAARMRPTDICVKIGGDASDNADTFEEVLDKYTAAHSPATLRRMYEHRQWWGSALIALGGLGLAGLLVLALGSRRRGAPAPPA